MKKIVAVGGGTGLSVLLQGLKKYPLDISAIVTMTDDGLSTGRLRRTFGILPPGDIRKTIVALSNKEDLLTSLFEYRFRRGKGLSGHSLGNLLILALVKITGSFQEAITHASEILSIKGKVIPSTLQNIGLMAKMKSSRIISGERKIFLIGRKDPIVRIWLDKQEVLANPEAIKAIKNAEIILIGPGSLWTSIIPNFLIKKITKTVLENKKAKKIYICNVSTERGETQNYSVEMHISKLLDNANPNLFDFVLVNNQVIRISSKTHKLGEINNITTQANKFMRYQIIKRNIINMQKPLFHDSAKLARVIWEISNEKK